MYCCRNPLNTERKAVMSYGIEQVFHKAQGSDKASSALSEEKIPALSPGRIFLTCLLKHSVKGEKCNVLQCQRLSTNERSRARVTLSRCF